MLKVSRSGYYRFVKRSPSERSGENQGLLDKIIRIHAKSRHTYGSPRVTAALRSEGETCSRKRVAGLMKKAGIQARMKRRFRKTTRREPCSKSAPNLLEQDFTAAGPNLRWVADMTYIPTAEGWLYVAVVLDLFSRKVVGVSMAERMTASLVSAAFLQAISHRKPQAGLLHHSDRGCQYTSQQFQNLLETHNITVSMSGTGNCFDNAAMESFFHTLKTEHVHFEQYATREEARLSIFEYIEVFYNRQRLHSTLGYVTPADFENRQYPPPKPELSRKSGSYGKAG